MSDVTLGTVTSKVTADTSSFEAGYAKAATIADATATRVEQTARRRANTEARQAKLAADAQATAAKQAGEVIRAETLKYVELQKVAGAADAEVRKTKALLKTGYLDEASAMNVVAAATQKAIAAKVQLAAAEKALAPATHASVSEMQAASAAVRTFEGNPGIRTLERTITMIPGLGAALIPLLPIIGGIFGAIQAGKAAKEVYDLEQAAVHAAGKIREAYTELHEKAVVSTDDIEVQNAKLRAEIATLSGNPGNGVAVALAEDKKRADELLVSLRADRKELQDLQKENSVGFWGSMLSGVSSTGKQNTEMLKDQQALTAALRKANSDYLAEVANTTDEKAIKAAADRRNKAVQAAYGSQAQTYRNEAARLRKQEADSLRDALAAGEAGGSEPIIDNSAKIANVEGRAQQLEDMRNKAAAEALNADLTAQAGGLKGDKKGAADDNRAEEQRLKAFEANLAQQKLLHSMSIRDVYDYWDARRNAFAAGSQAYNQVVEKQAALAVEGAAKAHEEIQKRLRELKASASEPAPKIDDFRSQRADDYHANEARYDANNQLAAIAAANKAKLEEIAVQDAVGKSITRSAAASELAAIHTREYGAELDRLKLKAAAIANDPFISEADKAKQLGSNAEAQAQIYASRQIQIAQDGNRSDTGDSSYMVGLKDGFAELANAAKDAASEVREFVKSTAGAVNAQLLKEMEGHAKRGDWRKLGGSVFNDAAGSALKQTEGYGLKMLGLGGAAKRDGSSAQAALYVQMASGLPAAMTKMPAMPKINVSSGGDGDDDDGSSDGSAAPKGGFMGAIQPFLHAIHIPGFADGGMPPPNSLIMIGEHGPELARTGSNGTMIIPNHGVGSYLADATQSASRGGDGGLTIGTIDARGTDAALASSNLRRATTVAYRRARADATRDTQEAFRRSPR